MEHELRYLRRRAIGGDMTDVHAYITTLRRRGVSYEVPWTMLMTPSPKVIDGTLVVNIEPIPDSDVRRRHLIAALQLMIEQNAIRISPALFPQNAGHKAAIQCHHVDGDSVYRQSYSEIFWKNFEQRPREFSVTYGIDDIVDIQIDGETFEVTLAELQAVPTPPNRPPLAEVLASISIPYGSFSTVDPRAPSGRAQPWRDNRPWHPSRVRR